MRLLDMSPPMAAPDQKHPHVQHQQVESRVEIIRQVAGLQHTRQPGRKLASLKTWIGGAGGLAGWQAGGRGAAVRARARVGKAKGVWGGGTCSMAGDSARSAHDS